MKQHLADLEKQEQAAEESLRPQTVTQVDQLQERLQAALEELKARRAELVQKEKEEGQKGQEHQKKQPPR